MLGLLVSFPLQGYGPCSITLLSLHILLGYYFCFLFYKRTRGRSEPSLWLAKASLFFFIFSSIGAVALGPIAASGMKQSPWYYYAILFYLHFQYNGMFVFGVLALFFHMLKSYGVEIREEYVNRMTLYLFVSCIPAYLLSVTWSDAGFILEGLAFLSAIFQFVSLYWLLRGVWPVRWDIKSAVTKTSWILLNVVALSYVIKLVLQGLSVIPAIARLASQVRYFLIGYLHLVLIGVVTFSLFIWLHERKLVKSLPVWLCWLMIVSFIVSEAIMVLIPLFGSFYQTWTQLLLVVSIVLFAGFSSYFFMFKSQSSTDIIFSSKPD